MVRTGGARVELERFDRTEMAAEDVFVVATPGGGGYGPPGSDAR